MYGIKDGWGTHIHIQNWILAFTCPDPRGVLRGFSRTHLSPVLKHFMLFSTGGKGNEAWFNKFYLVGEGAGSFVP